MSIDPYRLAIVSTAFQNLSARSQAIIFAVQSSSREAAAEELRITRRTVDQHYQRFLLASGLDDANAPAHLEALFNVLVVKD